MWWVLLVGLLGIGVAARVCMKNDSVLVCICRCCKCITKVKRDTLQRCIGCGSFIKTECNPHTFMYAQRCANNEWVFKDDSKEEHVINSRDN